MICIQTDKTPNERRYAPTLTFGFKHGKFVNGKLYFIGVIGADFTAVLQFKNNS